MYIWMLFKNVHIAFPNNGTRLQCSLKQGTPYNWKNTKNRKMVLLLILFSFSQGCDLLSSEIVIIPRLLCLTNGPVDSQTGRARLIWGVESLDTPLCHVTKRRATGVIVTMTSLACSAVTALPPLMLPLTSAVLFLWNDWTFFMFNRERSEDSGCNYTCLDTMWLSDWSGSPVICIRLVTTVLKTGYR